MNEREVVDRVREICGALPEIVEEGAWVGTRWRIRTRTFAHVLTIERGWPPAYARAVGDLGPRTVLMFRTDEDPAALTQSDARYFATPWRADEVGFSFVGAIEWSEIAELIAGSYCFLAPRRLAETVTMPPDRH